MNAVAGLSSALKQYSSDKVKDRAQAHATIRELFGNPDNVDAFQTTAERGGGEGWIAFMQVLFGVVATERRATLKKGSPQEAISLVRWVTERNAHLLSRRAFIAIFAHMTATLVHDGTVFEPAVIDYAKALRALLSYPPHLAHLDAGGRDCLVRICFAAVLGDKLEEDGNNAPPLPSFLANELLALLPIILTCPIDVRTGLDVLDKLHRCLEAQVSISLDMLKSLNLVLADLELNCRLQFADAANKLFTQLVALFTPRAKSEHREHVLIALRIVLPFVEQAEIGMLLDLFAKEGTNRGIRPLDLACLRLGTAQDEPFSVAGMSTGPRFDAAQALTWATLELYADCCFRTLDAVLTAPDRAKRQRRESPLSVIVSTPSTLAAQLLVFLVNRHFTEMEADAQAIVKTHLLEMLDDDALQAWAFIALSSIAILDPSNGPWDRLWAHAIRKSVGAVSRAACHAVKTLINLVDSAMSDVAGLLKTIDIQGPAYPHEAACDLVAASLAHVRSDMTLYTFNLEDKVVTWIEKTYDYRRARSSASPASLLRAFAAICALKTDISDASVAGSLPECPIVERILDEHRTAPIRRFILHAGIPSASIIEQSAAPPAAEVVSSLEGRAAALSRLLRTQLDSAVAEGRRANAERIQQHVELVVLSLFFQATLQYNGIHPDIECLRAANDLLTAVLSQLPLVQSAHGIWQAFDPIVHHETQSPPTWPILLKPDEASGIRRNILKADKYASRGSGTQDNPILSLIWTQPETANSLNDLVLASRAAVDLLPPAKLDDEDFGPRAISDDVAIGDKDYSDYYRPLIAVRLRGPILRDARPGLRDNPLINSFVSSEGSRFVQLGLVMCEAVTHACLRLTPDATELVLSELQDRIATYRYMRDEGMMLLCASFLRCSADIWLNPDLDLTDGAIQLFKLLVKRAADGSVSWRVRLALLLLIDDYIDYDRDVWGDSSECSPTTYIMDATADSDARVRFRAATSAAGLHYISSLDAAAKSAVYFDIVRTQTGDSSQWDRFLTDLLWKLSTCVASAQLRAATIFHLYEIADFAPAFAHHLQLGLESVASRLGLSSLAELYFAYANVVVDNQLVAGQLPLRLAPRLYGCSSRQEYATRCLAVVGAKVLANYNAHAKFFSALCEAANVLEEQAIRLHLPAAAAITYAEAYRNAERNTAADAKNAQDMIAQLPAPAGEAPAVIVGANVELVLSHLFMLLDCGGANEVADLLTESQRRTFRLLTDDTFDAVAVSALDPSAPAHAILLAREQIIQMPASTRKTSFDSLVRLFDAADSTFLVSEQVRALRAIALVGALYQSSFSHLPIAHLFLQGTVGLLGDCGSTGSAEIGPLVLRMTAWIIDTIVGAKKSPPNLADLLIQFGKVYEKLLWSEDPGARTLADKIRGYVKARAAQWQASDPFRDPLHIALAFWPAALAQHFVAPYVGLGTVSTLSRKTPMTLCRRLVVADEYISTFLDSTFWHLRQTLTDYDSDGAMAFLDLIYRADGRIRAPSLEAIRGLTKRSTASGRTAMTTKEAVVSQLLLYTHDTDYRLRAAAYGALRATVADRMLTLSTGYGDIVQFLAATEPLPVPPAPLLNELDTRTKPFNEWCTDLASILNAVIANDDAFYSSLQPMLKHSAVASDVLPYLVQATVTKDAARAPALSSYFSVILAQGDVKTTESIIDIVLHLRNFHCPYAKGELSYNHWLDIDHLLLSEAAGRCGAFASSLLFLEMSDHAVDLSQPRVQRVLYDIYSNVEDPDGFYGVPNSNVMDSLLRRLEHERQPARAFGYYAAGYEAARSAESLQPAIRNLHDLGFNNLAGSLSRSVPDAELLDLDLAWKMGDWDVPVPSASTSPERMYTALRAVHRESDADAARLIVEDAIKGEVAHLQALGGERMEQIKQTTANLVCLRDVARWVSKPVQKALEENDFEGTLLSDFVKLGADFEFDVAERLVATRVSLIRAGRERESKHLFGDLTSTQLEGLVGLERSSQLRLSELARRDGDLQAAVNAIVAVEHLDSARSDWAQDELCQVLWTQGEHSLAIQRLEQMKMGQDRRGAVLRGRKAHWLSLARVKAPAEIADTFDAAWRLAEAKCDNGEKAHIAYDYAVFCDHQYALLSKSPELERLRTVGERTLALQASQAHGSGDSERRHQIEREAADIQEDKQAKDKLDAELLEYLSTSLEMYARALAHVDDFDDNVTRLCSIWLQHDANYQANKAFANVLVDIPTHKFIVLGPQLAARLYASKYPSAFNQALNDLIFRLSRDHPFHMLYQILTLAHGVNSKTSMDMNPRGYQAHHVLTEFGRDEMSLAAKAARGMGQFANVAMDWCNWDPDGDVKRKLRTGKDEKLPSACKLLVCRKMSIPVATAPPPIDKTGRYDNIVTLEKYAPTFRIAGGVHRPAINKCFDSNGATHTQLFKGNDEVRQDAVMEQVFEMTNGLLRRDRKTATRNLRFRTYNVIPLANKTGIIEFVGGTMAIGDWLKDAHTRYRKHVDVSADLIRKAISVVQTVDPSSPELVTIYKTHMAKFKPVMRHFFTERNREPLAWFTTRLNYARSVAVTSIVGHMVGLGDRHCSNILIDTLSGEYVHIDFGIVFEEGRRLRVPEKVPFRLTNDTVDGLGITGVDGAFRQCSQHTLRVLRASSELILTVLEIFKHDPLYAWEGDPNKMRRAQNSRKVEAPPPMPSGQERADRILARIRQKLGNDLSVEYAVNQLIQEARDPENLAMIYTGWQPWM
ncbi:Serine/threonine-protein kinase tel1 [Cryptotrichosporon argae]